MDKEEKRDEFKNSMLTLALTLTIVPCLIYILGIGFIKLNSINRVHYSIVEEGIIEDISELKRPSVYMAYKDINVNFGAEKEVVRANHGREFSSKVGDKVKVLKSRRYYKNTGKTEFLGVYLRGSGLGTEDFVYHKDKKEIKFKNGEIVNVSKQ